MDEITKIIMDNNYKFIVIVGIGRPLTPNSKSNDFNKISSIFWNLTAMFNHSFGDRVNE